MSSRRDSPTLIIGLGGTGRRVLETVLSHSGAHGIRSFVAIDPDGRAAPDVPVVHVIGSVAGGTGSGGILDIDICSSKAREQIAEVLRSPGRLCSVAPLDFEVFMAELYRGLGYSVERTQQSHDGGVDLVLEKDVDGMIHRYVVQCKTSRQAKTVGVRALRELMGVLGDRAATAAILVTNTRFSRAAVAFLRRHAHRLFGVDGDGVLALARGYATAHSLYAPPTSPHCAR